MNKWILILCMISTPALAQEFLDESEADVLAEEDMGRDPAAVPLNVNRDYPGGGDEEDLHVLPYLPEAGIKTNTRIIQREVFKSLYNQELQDDRHDTVEE